MNEPDEEFCGLMARVRAGESAAGLELVNRFSPYVHAAARRRLPPTLRPKFDSTDFVQAVWTVFFCEQGERDFVTATDLIRFLITVTRNKLADESRRRLNTERYNVGREQSQATLEVDDEEFDAIDSRQPRPSQIAQAREHWSQLLAQQPPLHRQIVELRFQGESFTEIARRLNIHERTARRVFERLLDDR